MSHSPDSQKSRLRVETSAVPRPQAVPGMWVPNGCDTLEGRWVVLSPHFTGDSREAGPRQMLVGFTEEPEGMLQGSGGPGGVGFAVGGSWRW